jgi:hypothetical protein
VISERVTKVRKGIRAFEWSYIEGLKLTQDTGIKTRFTFIWKIRYSVTDILNKKHILSSAKLKLSHTRHEGAWGRGSIASTHSQPRH